MTLDFDDVGAGPVVVLLHGFPLDRAMWTHQVQALSSCYRVIAPDLRGHGRSGAPDGVYSVDAMADDVIELLDTLAVTEPVVVGGLSMGGYVAMSLAIRYPKRLRGLMLMNTRAAADPPTTARVREETARLVEAASAPDPVVEVMLPKLLAPSCYHAHPSTVSQVDRWMRGANPKGISNTLRGLAIRPDRTSELASIRMPTLVLAGADDQMIPVEESKRLAEGIPGARLALITDAGHLAPLENPSSVNHEIQSFLEHVLRFPVHLA